MKRQALRLRVSADIEKNEDERQRLTKSAAVMDSRARTLEQYADEVERRHSDATGWLAPQTLADSAQGAMGTDHTGSTKPCP